MRTRPSRSNVAVAASRPTVIEPVGTNFPGGPNVGAGVGAIVGSGVGASLGLRVAIGLLDDAVGIAVDPEAF
jgi:hypothetical protein